jgi:hypothetical protein
MKIKALGAVLAKRFGVKTAMELVPPHPTLGDVDSAQALADYQAAKKAHKLAWSGERRTAGKPAGSSQSRSMASRRRPGSE